MKKILIASSLSILAVSAALASPSPYIGAGLGIATHTSSFTATSTTVNAAGKTVQVGQPANFRGMPVNVFVGYGGVINQNLYLAGELGSNVTTAEITSSGGLKTTYGYSASILPGAMLSDHTMAFARIGVIRNHFSNANDTQTGGQLGLGLQTSVMQNIDIRGEYDFTAYGSFNNKYGRVSAPRSDAFNFGLIYKFD